MKRKPASALVDHPDYRDMIIEEQVQRVMKVDYVLSGVCVDVALVNVVTGEATTRNIRWSEHLDTETALTKPVGDGSITVELAELDKQDRWRYRVVIKDREDVIYDAIEVGSGARERPDNQKALATVVSFLEAAAEAREESDNLDLFSPDVRLWAHQNSSELESLALDLGGGVGL
jgi:hypothetical protein